MASITKTPEGTYRAQIRKKGYRTISKNFTRKTSAERWARQVEVEMEKGIFISTTEAENTTVGILLKRYEEEIAPTKKSYADIKCRIKLLDQQFGHFTLAGLTTSQIKDYRDERLKTRKDFPYAIGSRYPASLIGKTYSLPSRIQRNRIPTPARFTISPEVLTKPSDRFKFSETFRKTVICSANSITDAPINNPSTPMIIR
ncbi:hypothetical protein [Marinobacter sp. SS8-8]|uniref:hypothetical protein n=1 Tax=Marinobacter sp. SS8-8 TaxID=3050452 RepID=UPI0026E11067|nr:hypothetical protein [Marinobacter sp. SS8-8]